MTRLEHLRLWSDDVPGVSLGNIPANQADLDGLRIIINRQADVINAIVEALETHLAQETP